MRNTLRMLAAFAVAFSLIAAVSLVGGCSTEADTESESPNESPATTEPAAGSADEGVSGEAVLAGACSQCHEADRIFVQGYGADWSAIVSEMTDAHGAVLTDEEKVAVVEFLGSRELSEGEKVVAGKCGDCHDATRIYEQGDAADWAAIVQQMTEVHGAVLTDEEKAAAVEFLEGL